MKRHFIVRLCTLIIVVTLTGCASSETKQKIITDTQSTETDVSIISSTEVIGVSEEVSPPENVDNEPASESFIDIEALGIKEFQYPAEFVLEENLQAAIITLGLSYMIFDDTVIETEDWKSRFIDRFLQNSRFSFDYLQEVKEKNDGKININELNYMQYSLTGTEMDFSSFVSGTINAFESSSTINYGWITDWTYEIENDGILLTVMLEVGYGELREEDLEERKVEVRLIKNPYSCFDGYSIASLSTEIIKPWVPIVVEE